MLDFSGFVCDTSGPLWEGAVTVRGLAFLCLFTCVLPTAVAAEPSVRVRVIPQVASVELSGQGLRIQERPIPATQR